MVVLPDESLYPCGSLAGRAEYGMGNLDSPDIRTIRLETEKTPGCIKCSYGKVCPGGCPARSILNTGNASYSPQDCALRRTAFEIAEEEIYKIRP